MNVFADKKKTKFNPHKKKEPRKTHVEWSSEIVQFENDIVVYLWHEQMEIYAVLCIYLREQRMGEWYIWKQSKVKQHKSAHIHKIQHCCLLFD